MLLIYVFREVDVDDDDAAAGENHAVVGVLGESMAVGSMENEIGNPSVVVQHRAESLAA